MSNETWSTEDGVALRDFLARVPILKLRSVMNGLCPAVIDAKTLLSNDAQAVARVAAMKAGWEAYEEALVSLSVPKRPATPDSNYRDMQ